MYHIPYYQPSAYSTVPVCLPEVGDIVLKESSFDGEDSL